MAKKDFDDQLKRHRLVARLSCRRLKQVLESTTRQKALTQARIIGGNTTASASFDEKSTGKKQEANNSNVAPTSGSPVSFNPVVRLEWPAPEKLYVETAYVSLRSELIKTFSRWHLLTLSPQAAVLRR